MSANQLFLFRHAKSSWKEPALSDFDRPLNKRGRSAAKLMADYMASEKMRPELILCSASKRTCETLAFMSSAIGADCDLRIEQSLYLASCEQLLKIIANVDSSVHSLMVIGHNPGLAELARLLGRKGDMTARQRLREKFPTAALATISCPVDRWRELRTVETHLDSFVRPRDVRPGPDCDTRVPLRTD